MYIHYHRLFHLRYAHNYFRDRRATGLSLKPTDKTRQILKDAGMLFRTIPGGITVLYRAREDGVTPVIGLSKLNLVFVLQTNYPKSFYAVTELDESSEKTFRSSNVLWFKNQPGNASTDPDEPEKLDHKLIDSVRSRQFTFTYTPEEPAGQVLLRVTDISGTPVSVGKSTDGEPWPTNLILTAREDGSFRQPIDLRGRPESRYTITIRDVDDTTTLSEEVIYADDELWGKRLLGLVNIVYEPGSTDLYGDTEEYLLRFNRRKTTWKYYIVNKSGNISLDQEELVINDSSSAESDYYDETGFTRSGESPHESVKIQEKDTVIFRSDAPIPFFEVPKPSIQLKKDDNTVLIKHLPNPSHHGVVKGTGDDAESEIYVFI